MRQKSVTTKLLQSVTEVYYEVRQVLPSATVITKWDLTRKSKIRVYIFYIMWIHKIKLILLQKVDLIQIFAIYKKSVLF